MQLLLNQAKVEACKWCNQLKNLYCGTTCQACYASVSGARRAVDAEKLKMIDDLREMTAATSEAALAEYPTDSDDDADDAEHADEVEAVEEAEEAEVADDANNADSFEEFQTPRGWADEDFEELVPDMVPQYVDQLIPSHANVGELDDDMAAQLAQMERTYQEQEDAELRMAIENSMRS